MNLTKEQAEQLKKELAKLSPEQLAELKKQQCPFCLIATNQIKTKKIYEDNKITVVLDINPATKGHAIIFTRKHYQYLFSIPDNEFSHLMLITNKLSSTLMKLLNAPATNIFIANGELAGQRVDHIVVHLIPRYKDDGINLSWESKKISESELEAIQRTIQKGLQEIQPKKSPKELFERYIVKPEERIP
ncbi:MAG: HIT family protein [Nanoarchaeota archaeon]